MTTLTCEVAVIGAGPYGLSAAAYLRAARIETRVFGIPMEFWREHMPEGMLLRSSWEASHLSDPKHAFTLDAYQAACNTRLSTPIPLRDFIHYGKWFQQQAVPEVDACNVTRVEPNAKGFRLYSGETELVHARRVVVATGLARFAYRPPLFDSMPSSLVSHASDNCDLCHFAGQKVVVVGGGQSALETAVLMHEAGAEVEVLARAPFIRWLGRSDWLRHLPKPLNYVFFPPSDVGPPGLNWLVALPDLFRRLPHEWQRPMAFRAIRPAVSGWVRPRAQNLRITTGCQIVTAVAQDGQICLRLGDGTGRCVDHVVLATGYRVDVARLDFLAPGLVQGIRREEGYPLLAPGFESSVAGLHLLGAAAARSFGPLMRFVAGTGYAARALTKGVAGE
jgi:lysine/ornithine N-monooxygenase